VLVATSSWREAATRLAPRPQRASDVESGTERGLARQRRSRRNSPTHGFCTRQHYARGVHLGALRV